MSNSMGVGFMAVFAVSGSVVLLVHQLHKRLLSDFMKKVESEYDTILYSHGKNKIKEPSSNNEEYRKRKLLKYKQVLAMKYVRGTSNGK
ncbi:hypothetical protein CFP56_012140 [Quercus suber]|uniref:Uncharacterized protein n=1 Tax=Quercus suber TaxID=58331 RepID=A0AAW0KYE3_QUESU